ncbi:MAG TPA: ATPase domain-containing protein, partial [Candidatus Micrarchaeota archaeon]|nr:ATPase domain-containing protein [Candidatus Micrarchaeota archaeon]
NPNEYVRAISVRKMRATRHSLNYYPFGITEKGVSVRGKGMSGNGKGYGTGGPTDFSAKRAKPAKKEEAEEPMVDIGTLKSKGTHSWKWKHL